MIGIFCLVFWCAMLGKVVVVVVSRAASRSSRAIRLQHGLPWDTRGVNDKDKIETRAERQETL
jgi:hypothetical protein